MESIREYTNGNLFNLTRNLKSFDANILSQKVLQILGQEFSNSAKNQLNKSLQIFCSNLKIRWKKANYTEVTFRNKNDQWLSRKFLFPPIFLNEFPSTSASSSVTRKRSCKSFDSLSTKQKMRRTEVLRSSPEVLTFAIAKMTKSSDARSILEYMLLNPKDISKIKKFCDNHCKEIKILSKEEALNLFIGTCLTKHQYNNIRKAGVRSLPSYYDIQKAKCECYPEETAITITEKGAKIKLQELLDHTAQRLVAMLGENIPCNSNLSLICKWGCDGASGQSIYKQKFEESSLDDSSIFMCSLVPIKLLEANSCNKVLWLNERSSSTRFCRPIEFEFRKETPEVIQEQVNDIDSQIKKLIPSKCSRHTTVNHTLVMTMTDGKVCNAVTNTSSTMRCYICGATSKDMNDLNAVASRPVKEEWFKLGMSPLHAKIKFMECLIHISYNLSFQNWRVTKNEEKAIRAKRKLEIQTLFKDRLGLLIDIVKQGAGNTNDGNTARRFFADPRVTAEITGLDMNLIYRFAVILQAITSGKKINVRNFSAYARETAELYTSLYDWYYMPVTVHKILIHGADIIKHAIVPIGLLSEEAQEANNKKYKIYREKHSRKISRLLTNEDILHNMLIASDPLISSIQETCKMVKKDLFEETKNLLDCQIIMEEVEDINGNISDEKYNDLDNSDGQLKHLLTKFIK